jgi:hypothetical protein
MLFLSDWLLNDLGIIMVETLSFIWQKAPKEQA